MVNDNLQEYQSRCCIDDGEEQCDRPVFIKSCSAWMKRPLCRMHYARVIRHGTPGGVSSRWRATARLRDRRGKDLANRLNRWMHHYGTVWRIRKISLPIAPLKAKSAWIAQHKNASGPRQGAHADTQHSNTVRAWVERGWVHLDPVDDSTYEVTWLGGYTS